MSSRLAARGGGPGVALRRVVPEDRAFLLRLYASTRAEELALVAWPEAERRAFVEIQFAAQDHCYRSTFPGASFDVVLLDGERAGRLYVDRSPREVRIVDIALLPERRGSGIGTLLLRHVLDDAAGTGAMASLHVVASSPAVRLYTRLGFAPALDHGDGVYTVMRWSPGG